MDQENDNTDLPVPEGSTPSTSGQKYIGKHPLMTEQESDSKPPLGKEDGHVSNNADALVTGPRLLTPPVSYVASNSNPEKKSSENEVVSGDDFGVTLEKLKEEIKRLQLSEISLMEENEELKLDKNYLVEELDRQQQQIKKFLIEFVKSTEDKAHALMQELEAGSFGREEPRVPKTTVERQNEEESPVTMKFELDRIEVGTTDVVLMKVAVVVASGSELTTQGKPAVGCIIYRYGDHSLPNFALGWNGFVQNKSYIDPQAPVQADRTKEYKNLFKYCCLHAEKKALLFSKETLKKAIVYVTHMPCCECAKALCEAGVRRVFYLFCKKDSNIEPFKRNKTTSCICFPRRDLILKDFSLEKLKEWGITLGDTETGKQPKDCPSHKGTEDYN